MVLEIFIVDRSGVYKGGFCDFVVHLGLSKVLRGFSCIDFVGFVAFVNFVAFVQNLACKNP